MCLLNAYIPFVWPAVLFQSNMQQDAQEMLNFLLNSVAETVKKLGGSYP